MTKEEALTKENFDVLLCWLDDNRELAGQKYEKIRRRLIRIFRGRGCFEAEELADETFNRVTQKLPQLIDGYVGEPILYFLSVAEKIYFEWLRKQKKIDGLRVKETDNHEEIEIDIEYDCLENCLATLHIDDYRLVVEYYCKEGLAKIENRRRLAESFGVSSNALRAKAFRIRARLKECVRKCVAKKIK